MSRQPFRAVSIVFLITASLAAIQNGSAESTARIDVPFHHQEKNGCGPASLKMLQGYWSAQQPGLVPPLAANADAALAVSSEQGALLSDMRQYLNSNGFHAFTIQASPTDLAEQLSKGRVPIVVLRNNPNADLHYVVVTGLDERRVWLNDPAKSKPGNADRRKFEESWNRAGAWMLLAVPRRAKSE